MRQPTIEELDNLHQLIEDRKLDIGSEYEELFPFGIETYRTFAAFNFGLETARLIIARYISEIGKT